MPTTLFNVEAVKHPLTGIGRYAFELSRALRQTSGDIRVVCYPDTGQAGNGGDRHLSYTLRRHLRRVPGAYELLHQARNRAFRRAGPTRDAALYHEPNFVLRPFDGPCVTTCHDLSHIRFPAQHPRERRRFLERHLEGSLRRAERIIVPSAFVREEVAATFGFAADKVRVVPLGVDPGFHPRDAADLLPDLAEYGLAPGGYLLTVATLEPRKNLTTLAQAYAGLPDRLRRRYPLVIVGARGWHESELRRGLEPLARAGEARVLGYVPEDLLRRLYAGAAAFAYLSAYEGFGLPCLEAMASGMPVLTSTAGSLREVTGEAALQVPPHEVEAVRERLAELLEDDALRRRLAEAGRARAAPMTWPEAARRTLAVYRELLAPGAA